MMRPRTDVPTSGRREPVVRPIDNVGVLELFDMDGVVVIWPAILAQRLEL